MRKKSFIWLIVLLVAVCMVGCGQPDQVTPASTEASTESNLYEIAAPGSYDSEGTAIITKISEINRTITFYDYEINKSYTLNYDGITRICDRYGTAMSAGQLKRGSIVDILFLKSDKLLVSLKESANCFSMTAVTGFDLNVTGKVFSYNGDSYRITQDTILISENDKIGLNDLNSMDKLTITGIGNDILSISVETGHGYVSLKGGEYFTNGFIEIGTHQIEKITEKMLIMVPEGKFDVKISNRGTEVLRTVSVKSNEETVIDLSDIEIEEASYGNVLFAISPANSIVKIDGKVYDHSRLLSFEYGIHQVEVECAGYESVTRYFNIGKEAATLSIVLEEVKNTSEEKEESKTDGHFVFITTPLDVEVYVDNTYIGLTPVSFAKVAGTHIITLRKTGYETRSFNINLENTAEDVRYTFDNLALVDSLASDSTGKETETSTDEKNDTDKDSTKEKEAESASEETGSSGESGADSETSASQ